MLPLTTVIFILVFRSSCSNLLSSMLKQDKLLMSSFRRDHHYFHSTQQQNLRRLVLKDPQEGIYKARNGGRCTDEVGWKSIATSDACRVAMHEIGWISKDDKKVDNVFEESGYRTKQEYEEDVDGHLPEEWRGSQERIHEAGALMAEGSEGPYLFNPPGCSQSHEVYMYEDGDGNYEINFIEFNMLSHSTETCTATTRLGNVELQGPETAIMSTTCLCSRTCAAGKYQDETGKNECKECSAGMYSSVGSSSCQYDSTSCPLGTYSNGLASCTDCVAGKHNNQIGQVSIDSCHLCKDGKYSSTGVSNCVYECPKGTVARNQNKCLSPKQENVYKEQETGTCVDQPGTMEWITSIDMCKEASTNVADPNTVETISLLTAPRGCSYDVVEGTVTFNSNNNSTKLCSSTHKCLCSIICAPGKYQDVVGESNCKTCKAGTLSVAGASSCPYNASSCPNRTASFDRQCLPICHSEGYLLNVFSPGNNECWCGGRTCNKDTGLFCSAQRSYNGMCSPARFNCPPSIELDIRLCEKITNRCQCSKCKPNFHTSDCIPCPESKVGLLITEMVLALLFVYFGLCCLYYVFRLQSLSGDLSQEEIKQKIALQAQSSIVVVLIHQVQILGLTVNSVAFKSDMADQRGLVDVLQFWVNIISLDVSKLFASPECIGEVEPLVKWGFQIALLLSVVVFFIVWYSVAKCFFKKKDDSMVVQTIQQIAVNVIMIGMSMAIIKIFLQIFNCTSSSSNGNLDLNDIESVLVIDNQIPCSSIVGIQTFARIILVLYFLLFVFISIRLIKSKFKGTLESDLEDARYRNLIGWAVIKYKYRTNNDKKWNCCKVAFLWEIFHIWAIKGWMIYMLTNNEQDYDIRIALFCCVLISYVIVRPYTNRMSNVVSVLFVLVNLVCASRMRICNSIYQTDLDMSKSNDYSIQYNTVYTIELCKVRINTVCVVLAICLIAFVLLLILKSVRDTMKERKRHRTATTNTRTIKNEFSLIEKRFLFLLLFIIRIFKSLHSIILQRNVRVGIILSDSNGEVSKVEKDTDDHILGEVECKYVVAEDRK